VLVTVVERSARDARFALPPEIPAETSAVQGRRPAAPRGQALGRDRVAEQLGERGERGFDDIDYQCRYL